jgi:hypothetical protein
VNQRKSGTRLIEILLIATSVSQVARAAAPLIITSPINGESVTSGQSLSISVTILSGTYPHGIAIIGGGPLGATGIQPVAGSTIRLTLAIPDNTPPGSYSLTAVSADSRGVMVSSDPVSVTVGRPDLPTILAISPPLIFFVYVGQRLPWTIFANFAGGVQTDVTQSPRLIADSENPKVAIVEHGIVEAMGSGKTHINVRYGPIVKTIPITAPAYMRGDLNGDGKVDESDPAVIMDALHGEANGPNDARDLNHDGVIDERDAGILKTLRTNSWCASQ